MVIYPYYNLSLVLQYLSISISLSYLTYVCAYVLACLLYHYKDTNVCIITSKQTTQINYLQQNTFLQTAIFTFFI